MAGKRYTTRRADRLLTRLVAVTGSAAFSSSIDAKGRRVLEELLRAPLGDLVVQDKVRIQGTRDSDLLTWLQRVHILLLRGHPMTVNLTGVTLRVVSTGDDEYFEVSGPAGALLWLQVVRLVNAVGRERLRACDCGRLFVRVGKRQYCSTRCQKRVYMKRFRAGETSEE